MDVVSPSSKYLPAPLRSTASQTMSATSSFGPRSTVRALLTVCLPAESIGLAFEGGDRLLVTRAASHQQPGTDVDGRRAA